MRRPFVLRRRSRSCDAAVFSQRARPIINSMPPICGSNASRIKRSMAKESAAGLAAPALSQATILDAASVCGSAACSTELNATPSARWRSVTASSRLRQKLPTPPLHSRSRDAKASRNASCAIVTAGVTRDARVRVTSAMLTEANPMPEVIANTKVVDHTSQATAAVARRRACQS
jgi:hypothetical protein